MLYMKDYPVPPTQNLLVKDDVPVSVRNSKIYMKEREASFIGEFGKKGRMVRVKQNE